MSHQEQARPHDRWAHLRFSIVGPLLAAPPEPGELKAELERLASKEWLHAISGQPARFALSTIERWYYAARAARTDPVGVLRRALRKDSGRQRVLDENLCRMLEAQYRAHKRWSYQLHFDNLQVLVHADPKRPPMPSYSTIRRYMKNHDFVRQSLPRGKDTAGLRRAEQRRETREVRSYESGYVSALWHLDFHHGSRKVMTPEGSWATPLLLGILDDRSRLVCHLQWYLSETAEDLIHGLCQAFLKRGLPRSLLSDNGAAMTAAETRQGLLRLGIIHETTLPYSPHQNGKQESFWGQVEGRLLAMLDGYRDLTLPFLNEATQAWVEMEYQREVHSETGQTPLDRFLESPDVGRVCPVGEDLRLAFCQEVSRTQRKSDGTISIKGVRFEIPSRFRHLPRLSVRYASWDLGYVHLTDPRSGKVLARIYPLDRALNADGLRRSLQVIDNAPEAENTTAPRNREMGEVFGLSLSPHNRYASFKVLREKWEAHLAATLWRPVLVVDEAQEMKPDILSELRLLSSTNFDSHSVLTVVLGGDGQLLELLRQPRLIPLGTRIRTRLNLEYATPKQLAELLAHLLTQAGNPRLMTAGLVTTLCEHAAGNCRMLCNMAAELLTEGLNRDVTQLDEKLYLEVFGTAPKSRSRSDARRAAG